ncbi:hypothetical protein F9L07_22680 [Pimelobacter simplex]|uniref:Terminase small subunit n=1 Tax=Nocardioides simplex TaxID=2045 RepID=A0A7J5DT39_NOCSI|nr:hypothetical protein [Pimelobacter simplex]KAB2808324.1 hypothetical protein F9L07_22680 [Pimelobacter simplex]
MTRGGARNRSGPGKDPNSLRSAAAGVVLTALPSEGYDGEVPDFPLMAFTVYRWEYEDKRRFQVTDTEATEAFRDRELELWEQAWTYPQACAWISEPWRWNTIAMWVRTQVKCESSEATAADKGSIHRFADQIGMTPAGLKENGWAIARNEVGEKAAEKQNEAAQAPQSSARDRMTVVNGGGEG